MKKGTKTILASLCACLWMSSTAFAIYTGEEEEQKEGQPYTMTKMITEPTEVAPISVPEETTEEKLPTLYIISGIAIALVLVLVTVRRKKRDESPKNFE